MKITKAQVEDFSSSSIGAALFGYIGMDSLSPDGMQGMLDILATADLKQMAVAGVLFFLMYRHKKS
jgi:hypothetical protein